MAPSRSAGAADAAAARCPCGSGLPLAACCGPVLAGAPAPTPEALMRSRYTAFATGGPAGAAHLLATWHPGTRPASVPLDPAQRWTGLHVLAAAGGPFDDAGTVTFTASSERDAPDSTGGTSSTGGVLREVLRERSRFVRERGRWLYVDGELVGPSG